MKRNVCFFLVSFFLLQSVAAQVYFSKRDNYSPWNLFEFAFNVYQLPNGNYFTLGGGGDSSNHIRLISNYFANNGNPYLQKIVSQNLIDQYPGYSGSLIEVKTGGYACSGGVIKGGDPNFALLRFGNNMDTLWSKTYGDAASWDASRQVKQTDDYGFLIVGVSDSTDVTYDILVIKTDSSGNRLWTKKYGQQNYNEDGLNIAILRSKRFVIGAFKSSSVGGTLNNYLVCADSSGNQLWTKQFGGIYNESGSCVAATSDGGVITASHFVYNEPAPGDFYSTIQLHKLDSAGNVLWQKEYGDTLYGAYPWVIYQLPDGGFITTGNSSKSVSGNSKHIVGFILRTDANGNQNFLRYYDLLQAPYSQNYLRDVKPTSDGGFIATGAVMPAVPDTGTQDVWILKIDSMGCEVANCTVGMMQQQWEDEQVKIYPNPNDGIFRISGLKEEEEIFVYDGLGKLAFTKKINNSQEQISLTNLENGIYFLKVADASGGIYLTRKMIIQR